MLSFTSSNFTREISDVVLTIIDRKTDNIPEKKEVHRKLKTTMA